MVTRQDLQRVAQRYFSPEALSLVFLGATDGVTLPTASEVQDLCQQLDTELTPTPVVLAKSNGQISFTTFNNGVRVIVKEHHEVPVMAIQAAMFGGLLFEDDQNVGINTCLTP